MQHFIDLLPKFHVLLIFAWKCTGFVRTEQRVHRKLKTNASDIKFLISVTKATCSPQIQTQTFSMPSCIMTHPSNSTCSEVTQYGRNMQLTPCHTSFSLINTEITCIILTTSNTTGAFCSFCRKTSTVNNNEEAITTVNSIKIH